MKTVYYCLATFGQCLISGPRKRITRNLSLVYLRFILFLFSKKSTHNMPTYNKPIVDDLLRKLSIGAMSVLRIDVHDDSRKKSYRSVREYEDVLWKIMFDQDRDRAIRFAKDGILAFPIEESYILYYDICKVLQEDSTRFEWMLHFCMLLMYSYRATGKALSQTKYGSYLQRVLHFCGLSHRRSDVLRMCETAVGEDEIREQLHEMWQDRRRAHEKQKSDPLLDKAREYVTRTGNRDPQKLRFNVGRFVIGRNRACRLIDMLEDEGTIRPEDNPNWN